MIVEAYKFEVKGKSNRDYYLYTYYKHENYVLSVHTGNKYTCDIQVCRMQLCIEAEEMFQ